MTVVTVKINRMRKGLLVDGDVDLENDEGFGLSKKMPLNVPHVGERKENITRKIRF